VAKSLGLLTVGIVTIPFYFEKKMKIVKALKGVEEMRKNVDALLIINNERLCDVYSDSPISVKDAFKRADDILDTAARSISELITIEGEMNLDFRDVEATMRGGGGAIMAMGRASGEKRVQAAVTNALESPLLYGRDITKAKRILFNIYTGEEAPLFVNEMNEIDAFMDSLDPNIEVIWGLSNDNTIGTDAKVTILATGLGDGWNDEAVNASIVNSDEYYDEIISKLYSRSKRNAQPVEIEEPKTEEVLETHEDVSMPESDPAYDDEEEEEPEDKPLPKVPNPVLEKLKLMVLKFFNE
jgi:cell division protein FtsZ